MSRGLVSPGRMLTLPASSGTLVEERDGTSDQSTLPTPHLCRTLPLLIFRGCLSRLLPRRIGVFEHGQEQWAVVMVHALVAPGELEQEDASSIQPRPRV